MLWYIIFDLLNVKSQWLYDRLSHWMLSSIHHEEMPFIFTLPSMIALHASGHSVEQYSKTGQWLMVNNGQLMKTNGPSFWPPGQSHAQISPNTTAGNVKCLGCQLSTRLTSGYFAWPTDQRPVARDKLCPLLGHWDTLQYGMVESWLITWHYL